MGDWTLKSICSFLGVYLLCSFGIAQDTRHRLPTTRRRLPTVIITREHLRQRPTLYGPYGDTAAEFIVSAGLDTSKSSAVRIHRLGDRRNNSTRHHSSINNRINDSSVNEINSRRDQHHPDLGPNYRRGPGLNPQIINRRQDIFNERNKVMLHNQRFFPTADVNINRGHQQYIPPIFVPHYQQHIENNLHRPIPDHRGNTDHFPDRTHVNSNQEYRTPVRNPGSELHLKQDTGLDRNIHNSPISVSTEEERGSMNSEKSKDNPHSSLHKSDGDPEKVDVKKSPVGHNIVIAETPVLRLNRVKPQDVQNHIIRRPSLILRDQITVNEVSESSDRPRYGPRALQHNEETSTSTRRKRQLSDVDYSIVTMELNRTSHKEDDDYEFVEETPGIPTEKPNEKMNSALLPSMRSILDEFRNRGQRIGRNYPFTQLENHKRSHLFQSNSSEDTNMFDTMGEKTMSNVSDNKSPYYSEEYFSGETDGSPPTDHEGDVMSFSDFLASPIAEKIRMERQSMFRNSNLSTDNPTEENLNSSVRLNSLMQNASVPLLRNIIAARLLHGILNLGDNYSSNETEIEIPLGDRPNSRSSSDSMSSAEQRQFGIVVSPYDGLESIRSKSTMPIIRILRGKIVPLPDLPQELIPIILGTYRPTYTSETTIDDPKLTESILDNAILSLLQNEEMMHGRPTNLHRHHPSGNKFNRKSPSTNYIGSLKASEPVVKSGYSFKPAEWSLGPRCDRLTEEICLDDSDYPSSAIMSSIYKDKAKFDLMYAEVKVRESQVEGLSRQQEQEYSIDHYYGPYSQGSASNLDPRDYGPNGGFVCPSEVHYGRPHRAKNRKGEWKVVVNVGEYTQTLRMEKCLGSGNPCKYVVSHMQSTCAQVYSYHRLLVFNKDMGLHIDLFRVPTGCTCHLRAGQQAEYLPKYSAPVPLVYRPGPYEEFGGHVETAPSPQVISESSSNANDKKNSFSSTLWAILGGGQQASVLAQQPQFLDEVQKQIGWTQQLKQFPQLLKQISPNQVLKQLLENDEDEDYNIRRQRVRQKPSANTGAFASHHVPIAVPLPPPPPPPMVISRRPVVSAATTDQKHLFGMPSDQHTKVIAISSSEPTKIFSLTNDAIPGKKVVRISESNQQSVFGMPSQTYQTQPTTYQQLTNQQPGTYHQIKAYKISPGMYHPSSVTGEKFQMSEASLLPVAPQFSEDSASGIRPVLRPMRTQSGSDKRIVEDDDLIAVEKSEGDEIHAFRVETVTDEQADGTSEDNSKINFSYHPILEYLNNM